LFLGPGGTGKSHLAQAISQAAVLQGHKVHYRETHILLEGLPTPRARPVGTGRQNRHYGHATPVTHREDRRLPGAGSR